MTMPMPPGQPPGPMPPMMPDLAALGLMPGMTPPDPDVTLSNQRPDPEPGGMASLGGDVGLGDIFDDETRTGLAALYGPEFPLLNDQPDEDDFVKWAEALWDRHTASVQSRLHMIERNRLFRKGIQWVSAVGMGPWREPDRPRDAARIVENVIAPALDQRVQLITEQRPGFRVRPASASPQARKRAEAQQIALEYQYDQQQMARIIREAAYWAGTDGVSFVELYWDNNRGAWYEPLGMPLGDICPKVRRIEQVRVSADARANKRPWYIVIRETIPHAAAAKEYGAKAAGDMDINKPDNIVRFGSIPSQRLGFTLPEEEELLREQDVVDRITVYCDKSEFMQKGLTLICVGNKVQFAGPLVTGEVPLVRFTDGSADPSYFPEPIMDGWIDSQMRINAVKSKWVENVRLNAGPRLLAKANSVAGETLMGGTMTVVDVKGLGPIGDSVRPIQGFSLAQDAIALLQSEVKHFEDISGWNQVSRGQFSSDQSGRAIMAIRESLERIFAMPVNAASDAMADWARITLAWMRWGYDVPRMAAIEGGARPDRARELTAQDMDGNADVYIDPETLMPMPRSMRLALIEKLYSMQLMSPREARRRMPFAWIHDATNPDEDQEARAYRCIEALRQGQMLPILWQDNEAIHQDALERELILPDDTPPPIRQMATQRWNMLGQQSMMKMQMGVMMPPGPAEPQPHAPGPMPPGPPGGGQPGEPMPGGGPTPIGAPQPMMGTPSDEQLASRVMDQNQLA